MKSSQRLTAFAAATLFFTTALQLTAQSSDAGRVSGPAEPGQTEILVPRFVLEVAELGVDQVEAVLPSADELSLGRIALPLPGADELVVSDIAFNAPLPTVSSRSDGPSVFSTGRLGAGTANRVLGELSIYKLGLDPRFRLGFFHEGIDGYQFNQAGSGFYGFTNSIETWLAAGSDVLSLEVEGGFTEEELGLQDLSAYNAVSIRETDATAELTYVPDPLITLTGAIDAGLATRRQTTTGAAPVPTNQEYVLLPDIGARFTIRSLDLIFGTSYYLRSLEGTVPTQQDLDFSAGFEAALPWSMVIGGHAGVFWDFATGLSYPWGLSIESLVGDALELRLGGGFRIDRTRIADYWDIEPLLAVGDAAGTPELLNNEVWHATADARWSGSSGFSIRSIVEFTSESGTMDVQPYNPGTDQFPYLQRPFLRLSPAVQAAWQPSPVWQFEAGWKANILDRTTIEASSLIEGAVRFTDRRGVFAANLNLVSALYPEANVPWLDFEGSVSAGDGVEVVLELSDILAPLISAGRATHGSLVSAAYPFIEPGFVASIVTRITL